MGFSTLLCLCFLFNTFIPFNNGDGVDDLPFNNGDGVGDLPFNNGDGVGDLPFNNGDGVDYLPYQFTTFDPFKFSDDLRIYPCGDDMFFCIGSQAGCSFPYLTIPYVPRFPDSITEVDIDPCMPESPPVLFFFNLTKVQTLKIGSSNLKLLSREMFIGMDTLQRLILNDSPHLTARSLREVFTIPSLKYMELEFCNFSPFRKNPFQLLSSKDSLENTTSKIQLETNKSSDDFEIIASNIKGIDCDHNPWGDVYNLCSFCGLLLLSNLSCRHCNIQGTVGSTCRFESLSTLDLSYNSLDSLPYTCKPGSNESVFPKLTALHLAHNQISSLTGMSLWSEICLPSLTHLDLSHNMFSVFPSFQFSSFKFPLLKVLKLQNQPWDPPLFEKMKVQEHAFCNENLEELDLSNTGLKFGNDDRVSKYAFSNCSSLRRLNLKSNNFSFVDDQRFLELFGHLHCLVNLSLSSCSFESLTPRTFANFHNMRVLSLDGNGITELPDKAFDLLGRLQSLHLQRNKIKKIGELTFSQHLRDHLSSLTLGFNPFHCSCDLRWFAAWYQTEQQGLFTDSSTIYNNYQCDNLNGLPLRNFSLVDQACLLSHETHLLVIEFCSLFIVALMLSFLLFRYRWHVRLLVYDVFRGRENLRRQRLLENHFDFDVFVSYASDDMPWVREHLMPKMENDLGLRLCLHERDFTPGHHIVDNIARCVDSSKKVLMVFSEGFVHSQWCQFELAYCLTHVLDCDDAVLVVCVDDVTSRQMTSSMRAVLRTMTYIQWREGDEDATASFWGRLLQGLHEIMPHNEHLV